MKLGIDIGGSHIGIGLVENNGNIVFEKETYIKDKTDIENRIERYITENVIEILQAYGVNQIGIAVPGTVTDKKIIKAVNLGIVDYDLGNILEQNLLNLGYTIDVKLKNDGKCAALAEYWRGSLKGCDNGAVVVLGSGVAGGIILNGEIYRGRHFTSSIDFSI